MFYFFLLQICTDMYNLFSCGNKFIKRMKLDIKYYSFVCCVVLCSYIQKVVREERKCCLLIVLNPFKSFEQNHRSSPKIYLKIVFSFYFFFVRAFYLRLQQKISLAFNLYPSMTLYKTVLPFIDTVVFI